MELSIGDLIDKLSIINLKIWDATGKAHEEGEKGNQVKANEYIQRLEAMNIQRKELIDAIDFFFNQRKNILNEKSYKNLANKG